MQTNHAIKSPGWPGAPVRWISGSRMFVSIPFTWNLPALKQELRQRSIDWTDVVVGGPAVKLIPGFFSDLDFVTEGDDLPGVMQFVNPLATRTTKGCNRKCGFCAVGSGIIEKGGLVELEDWPDLPVICDNNILQASQRHFDRVIDRLKKHGWADFNQGIDARLLTDYHAERLSEIGRPIIRLALDNMRYAFQWENAFSLLRSAGLALSSIRSYAIIGYDSGPDEAWERLKWIEAHNIKALPMWFHGLNELKKNRVTSEQSLLGWDDYERRRVMQWFYKHKMARMY